MCAIAKEVRASRKEERDDWREVSWDDERVEESAAKEDVVDVCRDRADMPPPRRMVGVGVGCWVLIVGCWLLVVGCW